MLKYVESSVVFSEFPDEISLCLDISQCPNNCKGCSESYLAGDIGTELTEKVLEKLIDENPGITLVGFMGGDNSHEDVSKLADFIHSKNLKVGMYSGREYIDTELMKHLDYYKIGSWRQPEGPVEDWWKTNCGPLKFTFSNQLMFKRDGNIWWNITGKFREHQLNNLEREIL